MATLKHKCQLGSNYQKEKHDPNEHLDYLKMKRRKNYKNQLIAFPSPILIRSTHFAH